MKKVVIIIAIILVILSVIFEVSLMTNYGNTPTGEVPFWVVWFLN